jgi:hypothetical protein
MSVLIRTSKNLHGEWEFHESFIIIKCHIISKQNDMTYDLIKRDIREFYGSLGEFMMVKF